MDNIFQVSLKDDMIIIDKYIPKKITKEEANNLAAWLVATTRIQFSSPYYNNNKFTSLVCKAYTELEKNK